ncbi:hypothetical protein FPOAC1_003878 [Fusarium poae]|uniref:hypothetical protein n=1 Tax=Fusarium poae TaxID=36050 RepID=UPI001CEB5865|nr:hypothetical protein FPOAC1_003878 [Fusarium poae]KAG8677850.1 hypothetical protein FPOAC1_003878 [Fusarium poae]
MATGGATERNASIRSLVQRMSDDDKHIVRDIGLHRLVAEVSGKLSSPLGKHLWATVVENFERVKDRTDNNASHPPSLGNAYEHYVAAVRHHHYIRYIEAMWMEVADWPSSAYVEENTIVFLFIRAIDRQARDIVNVVYPEDTYKSDQICELKEYVAAF